jgi:hypothetical protein
MRKKMFGGVDFIGQDDEIKVFFAENLTFLERMYQRLTIFIDKATPLRKDVRKIGVRFGSNIRCNMTSLLKVTMFSSGSLWHSPFSFRFCSSLS